MYIESERRLSPLVECSYHCNSAVYYTGMLYLHKDIFMAALRSSCGRYIFNLSFLSSSSIFFSFLA